MSGTVNVRSKARECSITAVVTRADGTTENLGEIAYWHRNPIRRWTRCVRNFLTR